ncbi:MAG TPA: DUF6659 family protein [Candidatus Nitrosotenuis sp.]|nr:DUF6659 family protein [Candidatus Nitrosotenuis sp.]
MTTIPLTAEHVMILESICNKLCDDPKIRFCGIISPLGRLVTGGFRDGMKLLDSEDQRRMLYTQSTLEASIKKEFDDSLGCVNLITTYRDNTVLINIPLRQNYLVLISADRNADVEHIVQNTTCLFEINSVLGNANNPQREHSSNYIPTWPN